MIEKVQKKNEHQSYISRISNIFIRLFKHRLFVLFRYFEEREHQDRIYVRGLFSHFRFHYIGFSMMRKIILLFYSVVVGGCDNHLFSSELFNGARKI
jgi:hypothetical protein